MKKKLLTILLFCAILFAPHIMRADNAATLAANISSFSGGGTGSLTAVASGNTVIVTGSLTDVTQPLWLDMDAGVTVDWQADISTGSSFLMSTGSPLIYAMGSGTLNVSAGSVTVEANNGYSAISSLIASIKVSGTGRVHSDSGEAISARGNVDVTGGEVSSTAGAAISIYSENSVVTVSGGTVSCSTTGSGTLTAAIYIDVVSNNLGLNVIVNGTGKVEAIGDGRRAIWTPGSVEVSGGEVSATTDIAIHAWGENSTVMVSGGEVSATTSNAIYANGASSAVTISGGTVKSAASWNPVIYLSNDNNLGLNVTVNGTGKVEATGDSGYGIESNGTVEINGGEVSSTTGNAVYSYGENSKVIINGGTVSGGGSLQTINMCNNINTGLNVIINGGTVQATGAGGTTIYTSGSVEVNGGEVTATTGIAISAGSENSTVIVKSAGKVQTSGTGGSAISTNGNVEVSGGEVSATTGRAIYASGDNSTVTVSGGTVSSGMTDNSVILLGNSNNTGLNVVISGTGKVEATGDLGQAIYTYGSVEVSGGKVSATTGPAITTFGDNSTIEVSGGEVSATTGKAIYAGGNSTVTVSGGLVFAYGVDINQVITSGFTDATGTGVVIAWNQAAGNSTYTQGTTTDISQSPASATVVWDKNGTSFGISYANGANTGFIPLSVTVVSAACDIASVESPAGATISGNSITASVATGVTSQAIALTTSPAATWKLFSDAVCTNEITNQTMTLAIGDNTAYIQVTAEDGTTKVYTIVITRAEVPIISVSSVTLDAASIELTLGDTEQLTATVAPSNATNQNVSWSSSNPAIADVDANGEVSALAEGSATITVTTEDGGFTATCAVTVNPKTPETIAVTDVTLDNTASSLWVGETQQLTAIITPADATNQNVSWISSAPSVATVSNTGLITAINKGAASITAMTEDGGYKATCAVNVQQQEVTVPDSTQTGSDGKGTIVLSLTIPADVLFSGSFQLTLPNGVQLDLSVTHLVGDLASQLTLNIVQNADGSWTFTITPTGLRSATELVYSQIVQIGYMVDKTVTAGTYNASIHDLSFTFDNGATITESEIPVQLTVSSQTGISDVTAKTNAYLHNGRLYVDSPVAERITVYSEAGVALYNFTKPAGSVSYPVETPKGSVLIVKGGSGWVKKVIEK